MQTEEGLEHTGTLVSELQQKSKVNVDLIEEAIYADVSLYFDLLFH